MTNQGLGKSSMAIGVLLIVAGTLFLLVNILDIELGRFGWPFFIIIPGILLFTVALVVEHMDYMPFLMAGSIITTVGTILLYQNATQHWQSWAYAWALVFPTSVGFGQIIYGKWKTQTDISKSGKRFAIMGIAIFLLGLVFFELVIGISGFGLGRHGWPLLLIGLGGLLVVQHFLKGGKKLPTKKQNAPDRSSNA